MYDKLTDIEFIKKINDITERAIALLKHYQEPNLKRIHINNMLDTIDKRRNRSELSRNKIEVLNRAFDIIEKQLNSACTQVISNQETESANTNNKLSVPDWCIVFYYLDRNNKSSDSKIKRMENFVIENNITNSKGILTSNNFFKKEYYKVSNRINCKENSKGEQSPPLPPERIKNILTYLKNNKKALQNANNDIDYLTDEIKENNKKYY
jgi:type II secretory pathway component PulJ